ncbi:ead/Ea22-like family protein [Citrobacter farmeri]|uniref:hypothetical protein n=1 Tax=Citrobacter farmeri TaxID=67824 RepID=UPI002931272C|nr:hypothetical protein [Citrobacter farmeri]
MSSIDKQALREEFQCMQKHYSDPADRNRQVIYIAAEALLDELEYYKSREERVTRLVLDNQTSWDELHKKLKAAEKHIAELRDWNLGLAQESFERQQRIAETSCQKRLIGWRASDYTDETSDPELAKNWAAAIGVLPIFEGDVNTKLSDAGIGKGERDGR